MTKKTITPFLALIVLTTGCSLYHVGSEETTLNYYPSKTSTTDIAFKENISQPHEVIGYVTVNAERRQKLEEVIEKMKREAAILGGDAITSIQSDSTGEWKILPAQQVIGNAFVRANFKGSVVKIK